MAKKCDGNNTPVFKLPTTKKTPVKPTRRSTRLDLLRDIEAQGTNSPVWFRPQRRSMRLSMRMPLSPAIATPTVPTPAPRNIINR